MKILLYKQFNALRPADEAGEEVLKGIPQGEWFSCEIKRPRNIRHHRKFWKLLSVVAENMPERDFSEEDEHGNITSVRRHYHAEEISDIIKIRTGHTKKLGYNGAIYEVPKSISFGSLDQTEFAAFYERAVRCICEELIPGIDSDALKQEVEELLR